ncbi:hypothetical protein C7S18_02490 [Ahniella affigens]|uniref:Uncharacterized protein n=2 Tax=Ahniella affigens TaxID=2021234 RepID=A0A2P1PMS3_9GAMM|nr:hypothetical protein C7S18_02490 [Ahniella affigens]
MWRFARMIDFRTARRMPLRPEPGRCLVFGLTAEVGLRYQIIERDFADFTRNAMHAAKDSQIAPFWSPEKSVMTG